MKTYPDDLPVWSDPERMGGTPCFLKTRVPVETLFTHIEHGLTLNEFLEAFDGVKRVDAIALLEYVANQFRLDSK